MAEALYLWGGTGSGKTTTSQQVLREYDVHDGYNFQLSF